MKDISDEEFDDAFTDGVFISIALYTIFIVNKWTPVIQLL
jgi:hypothetical protein